MCQLFETIQLQNGKLINLNYHNERLNKSRLELLNISQEIDLQDFIKIPKNCKSGLFRCRVSYKENLSKIEFFPYQFKAIHRIKLIEKPEISYAHKFEDRTIFQDLLKENIAFDEIIITQNKYLTDATFANLAFYDGTKWFTPTTYLLKGTKRSYLIDNKELTEEEITIFDIKKFKKVALINAMRDTDSTLDISVIHVK